MQTLSKDWITLQHKLSTRYHKTTVLQLFLPVFLPVSVCLNPSPIFDFFQDITAFNDAIEEDRLEEFLKL